MGGRGVMLHCKTCHGEMDELAAFPGGICLDCYKQTPDANRPLTADDIVQMWGGPTHVESFDEEEEEEEEE